MGSVILDIEMCVNNTMIDWDRRHSRVRIERHCIICNHRSKSMCVFVTCLLVVYCNPDP